MRKRKATFVCYADPPVAATASVTKIHGKIITPAKSWLMPKAKKAAIDSPIGDYNWGSDTLKPIKGASILAASWNRIGGLILLGEMPFDYLMDERCTSLCACLRHSVSCTRNGVTYLAEVIPTGFIPQSPSGGCNPGGFLHFPGAENFNISMYRRRMDAMHSHYSTDKLQQFLAAPKLDTFGAMKHFPDHNFASNTYLNKYDFCDDEVTR